MIVLKHGQEQDTEQILNDRTSRRIAWSKQAMGKYTGASGRNRILQVTGERLASNPGSFSGGVRQQVPDSD